MKGVFSHKLLLIFLGILCMVFIVVPSFGHALTINGNNVGIGTNAPSQPLDVVGNINTSGNVTAGGTLTGGSCSVTGSVTAGSLSGNGSGLTNLDPAKITSGTANINIMGNAANATTAGTANSVAWHSVTNGGLADNSVNPQNIAFYNNVAIVAPILVSSGYNYFNNPATAMSNFQTWCPNPTSNNPCLLKIMPGVYDVGASSVQMQSFIDIEGSGENTTIIQGGATSVGVVRGVGNAEIRFLTVINTGSSYNAIAIDNTNAFWTDASPKITNVIATGSGSAPNVTIGVYNERSSPTMTNVTATASGGSYNHGVLNEFSSSPTMTNVTATASGGNSAAGVTNKSFSSPTMTNVTATASGGSSYNDGVSNDSSSPTMTNVTAKASGVGSSDNFGVNNFPASSPTMTNVTVAASGGSNNYGVFNKYSSSPTMTNVTAKASGGSNNYGVYSTGGTGLPLATLPMTNVTATATGGTNNYGIYNDSAAPTMRDVYASATDGSGLNVGIRNDNSSSPILSNVTASASGGTYAYGLFNTGSAGSVAADRSSFYAFPSSVESFGIRNDSSSIVSVGSSKFSVNSFSGVGPRLCVFCYSGDYSALNSNCLWP